jgi:NADPH-dependent curcumin reductase CurA
VGKGVPSFANYMHVRKIDPMLSPISTSVGVMGMLGLTAYAGMFLQIQPKEGDVIVVSAASGGVGQGVCSDDCF